MFPCTSLMAKFAITKKDKLSPKKLKVSKHFTKTQGKIPKISFKRHKNKISAAIKKKILKKPNLPRKCIVKKGDTKLKSLKVKKPEKLAKNSSAEGGKKKVQRNNLIKNDVHVQPVKVSKIVSETAEKEHVVNGSCTSIVPYTKPNPYMLKLGAASQPQKPLTNGVGSNGTLVLCDTNSLALVPQKKSLTVTKKGDLSSLKKKGFAVTKQLHVLKNASKSSSGSHKETSKNGFISGTSSASAHGAMKKSGTDKIKTCKESKPRQKSSNTSIGQKTSVVKAKKLDAKEDKSSSRTKNHASNQMSHNSVKQPSEKKTKNSSLVKNLPHSKDQSSSSAKLQSIPDKKQKTNSQMPSFSNSKALCVRDSTKLHPQRMASLDAMAKMHVICSSDRRPSSDVARASQSTREMNFVSHQKSSCRKIHVGVKKETTREFKEHIIHSRINCVKVEKSVSERTEKVQTFCSISEEKEETVLKRSRGRPKLKSPPPKNSKNMKNHSDPDPKSRTKAKMPKRSAQKNSNAEEDCAKKNKTTSKDKKSDAKFKASKSKEKAKPEKTSKLKVKETIRMRKTCTYQSVTTVSSHEAVNSLVASCSRLGVTTNYESKKTVVRNGALENKTNLSLEEFQEPFLQALEAPCTVQQTSNCCSHLIHPSTHALIPLAHTRPCHGFSGTRLNSCSQHCCEGGSSSLPVQQCGHQQSFLYHHPPSDYGCCCSSSLLHSPCSPCIAPREARAFAVERSHCHQNPPPCTFCSHTHSIPAAENDRHLDQRCSLPSSSSSDCRGSWFSCCDPYRNMRCQSQMVHPQCPSVLAKPSSSSVPCDQTPLDLSVGASTPSRVENSSTQTHIHHSALNHCKDRSPFEPSHSCAHNGSTSYSPVNHTSCWNQKLDSFGERGNLMSCREPAVSESLSVLSPAISNAGSDNLSESERQDSSQCTAKNSSKSERNVSRISQTTKKRKFAHGWSWEGEPTERMLSLTNDSVPAPKKCYPAMRHREGDIIKERDCVLLKSGPKDTDLPYVAKVAAFWENPDDGEMMMSLLWYYRPEHTEQGRKPGQMEDEVFASKHRDVNSVACIEDKCYVLTFNEYCRYRANIAMMDTTSTSRAACTVPESIEGYARQDCLPKGCVSPDMIFFCRHVYDFRQKRILKNPT